MKAKAAMTEARAPKTTTWALLFLGSAALTLAHSAVKALPTVVTSDAVMFKVDWQAVRKALKALTLASRQTQLVWAAVMLLKALRSISAVASPLMTRLQSVATLASGVMADWQAAGTLARLILICFG
ncbi:hypothetical protein BJ741DRAFT_72966, partial [Chytriomyces cf. hyalinus JEL632]